MKKLIFVVAVAAIAAVSCSKTYENRTTSSEGTPIMLGSWADNLTKARAVGASSFASGDKFFAYAYTSTGQKPFEGTEVSYDGTDWAYSPLRFWDRNNDSYSFYGISPSEDVTAASLIYGNWTDGTFQSNSVTLSGENNDILVADKKVVEKAHYGETVELNFRHINALFDLKVRKGNGIGDNGVLKVTSVALENIDATGYFTVESYDGTTNAANVTWHSTAAATYTNTSGVNDVTIPLDAITTTADDQYLIHNLVVMPQTFAASAQRLKISYTITTGTGATEQVNTFTDKTYDLVLFDKTDYPTDDDTSTAGNQYNDGTKVTGFVGGVHYTYIITIDAETITFNATMTDWTTDDGYYYILN
jgi:hypothetical protein